MKKAQDEVITNLDINVIDEQHNKKLVHMSGKANNETKLVDSDLRWEKENCYRIKRVVEMYQYVETIHKKETDS